MYSYNGIGELSVTVYDKGMNLDCVAKIGESSTGCWCKADEVFHGVCRWQKENTGTLQVGGFITLPYSGSTAPAVGYCELVADGDGGVKVKTAVAGNVARLVVEVNADDQTVTFLL